MGQNEGEVFVAGVAGAGFLGRGEGVPCLTIMSRNLYLGADTSVVLGAYMDGPGALVARAGDFLRQVQANDFRERAVLLVDEIQRNRPDFVGMQEVVRVVHRVGGVEKTTDFLVVLEAELERRSLPYTFLPPQENTRVRLPLNGVEELSFLDRLAVLVHEDLPVTSVSKGGFQATQPTPGGILLRRGWIRVVAEIDGAPVRLVNTHLEVQPFADCQARQVEELLGEVVADSKVPTFLFGDFNSNAEGSEGDPTWTSAYQSIVSRGFTDLWAHSGEDRPGLTCCHGDDLARPGGAFDQRIDFVFSRGVGRAEGADPIESLLVGTDPDVRSGPAGLWPSDHAGLVVRVPINSLRP